MSRVKHLFSSHGRKFYFEMDDLVKAHKILFSEQDSFKLIERPFAGTSRYPKSGMMEAVLRCRFNTKDGHEQSLRRAFMKLFSKYGGGARFEISVTFNYILCGEVADDKCTYSMFFGQDANYSSYDKKTYKIKTLQDLNQVPTHFDSSEVKKVLQHGLIGGVSQVRVHAVVNTIYIVRMYLRNFQQQSKLAHERTFFSLF